MIREKINIVFGCKIIYFFYVKLNLESKIAFAIVDKMHRFWVKWGKKFQKIVLEKYFKKSFLSTSDFFNEKILQNHHFWTLLIRQQCCTFGPHFSIDYILEIDPIFIVRRWYSFSTLWFFRISKVTTYISNGLKSNDNFCLKSTQMFWKS